MKNMISEKHIGRLFLLGCLVLLAFLGLGALFLPEENLLQIGRADDYRGEWVQCLEDGSTRSVTIPGKLEARIGECIRVQTVLPDEVTDGTVMSFLSVHQEMKFYIDGELRFSYEKPEGVFFIEYPVRAYVPLELREEDAGKTLTVEITSRWKNSAGRIYAIYIGSMGQIIYRVAERDVAKLLLAVTLMLVAFITLVLCLILQRMLRQKVNMVWLCISVIFVMMWVLTDSRMRQLFFPKTSVAASMAYLVMILMTCSLSIYMDRLQKQRYHRLYQWMEAGSLLVFFLCFSLNMLGNDFTNMSTPVYGFLLFMIAILGVNLIRDVAGHYMKEYRYVAIGLCCICISGVVEISLLLAGREAIRQYSICLALFILVVLAGFQTVKDIRDSLRKEEERAEEADKARRELLSTLSEELLPLMGNLNKEIHGMMETADKKEADHFETEMATVLSFLSSIRDLSTMQGTDAYARMSSYRMDSFVKSVRSFLDIRTRAKGLEGELVVDPALPEQVRGCVLGCKHIVINLVEYAVQHTQNGYVVFSICGEWGWKDEFFLKLSVADNGSGIPRDLADKLEKKGREPIYGGDIRLISVRQMVQEQGGRMTVESVEGEGTLVTVLLPNQVEKTGTLKDESAGMRSYRTEHFRKPEKTEKAETSFLAGVGESAGETEKMKTVSDAGAGTSVEKPEKTEPDQNKKLVDPRMGIFYCGDSQDLYQEVLATYVKTGEEYLSKLELYVSKEDWNNYRIIVHALKSTSLNIGAETLWEAAKQQETAARENKKEEILVGWKALYALYQEVLAEAERLLAQMQQEEAVQEEEAGGLKKVKRCLEDYDTEAALAELENLKQAGFEPAKLLEELRIAIEDFDYEAALELIYDRD